MHTSEQHASTQLNVRARVPCLWRSARLCVSASRVRTNTHAVVRLLGTAQARAHSLDLSPLL
eukprot:1996582-Pleurochrysis_carterae.AAC.1